MADLPSHRLAYTLRETADYLGVPYKRMLRIVAAGRLRTIRDGQRHIVPVKALEEYLDSATAQ